MTKPPDWLSVPAITLPPASLVTGMDSPVTSDSSSEDRPSTMTPSTGTLSPGRTRNLSSTCRLSSVTSWSVPLSYTRRAGAQLQHLAEQDQDGNGRCRFEIDRNRAIMAAERRRENARDNSGDDAV